MLKLPFRGKTVGFCAGLLVFGLFAQVINAQGDRAARVRGLNNDLLRLHSEVSQNPPGQAVAQRVQAALVIGQRAEALRNLIQRDPAQALSLAFSPDTLADLAAAFPGSASQLESQGTWQGPIERWVADSADRTSSRTLTRMKVGGHALDLYFAGPEPAGLTSGSMLQVTGVQVGDAAAVTTSSITSPNSAGSSMMSMAEMTSSGLAGITTSTASSAPMCSTTGVQNTAVLLVTFPGVTPPATVTPTGVSDIFFGASGHSLDGFWREVSYGKTSATGNVFGWYTLDQAYTCTSTSVLVDAAIAAASADVNFLNYTRVFVILPYDLGCGWSGLATIGCSTVNSPAGPFTASTTYLTPNDFGDRDRGVELVTHEAGHNLGLHHASWRDFGTEALGPVGVSGSIAEYGDVFSTMGFWNLGQYSAPHKAEILNWLAPGTNYQVVQTSGTWSLQPLETSPAGLQALKVQRGTGNNAWLWIEYRQPAGNYDSALTYTQPFGGALIHYEDSLTGIHTHLLDFTPETDTWADPALLAGQTWTDPYTNLSITVQSATANALTVNVNYAGPVCTHANPTVSASPLNPSTSPGKSVGYNIVVTNNDSTGCSAGTFSLASSQPSGWPTSFSTTSLPLGPGQTGTVTMTKNVPASVLAGIYAVDTTAAAGTLSGLGLANVTVTTPPAVTVAVSTPNATYAVRQTVTASATVLYGATPAAGASVKFTMTDPSGGTSTKTVAADSSGKAVWNYKIGGKGPLGAYSVTVSATYNSQTAAGNATTFTVK
jgi:M6 family metalloprotease-like protein